MCSKVRAVFLDAGYTLLFPRVEVLIRDLTDLGFAASAEDFEEAERAGKRKLDELLWPRIRNGQIPRTSSRFYWQPYFEFLMDRLGVSVEARPALIEKLGGTFRDIRTWSRVLPETLPVLERLRAAGYFLAAISNSNGTVESELRRAGFSEYLRFVIDSAIVGVEKPDPEIFRIALRQANVAPEEALYVGDIYAVDVGGAQLAGLRGVLFDHVGAYPDAACARITSLSELSTLVEQRCV
ncbi:MAG: HAD family hydrolase [Acidobacteria bacterium]|nr:HAD family hydrolase [Acidobacteriota bacterium]